ncbi:hypothetical protein V8G54_018857 [Vigna mungo]|uniref:WAT1-related protein n=1 Tax=Vigna mungo TaxID=3915 RepID=A0AAQ3NAY4_VIGMU
MACCQQKLFHKLKPFIGVVFLQFGYSGMDILSKAALNRGMSNYVFVVYRHVFAFVVMAPFAESEAEDDVFNLYEDSDSQPARYTTATFAVSMYNVLPAITFVMAWILRLEKIKLKSTRSQAKVVGTLATVAGAMIMTLIKGPILDLFGTHASNTSNVQNGGINLEHAIKGSLRMFHDSPSELSSSSSIAAITIEAYPAELSLTAWICLLGTVEGGIVALVMERNNFSAWSLKWDTKLLAAVYSVGMAYYIQGVVMKDRGPVFVTTFNPLCMVIVAIMGSFFLAEQMYLGRAIGAIVIIVGLYLVVWGKSKDYESSSTTTEENMLSAKQTVEKSNIKEEHLSNLGTIARDEQDGENEEEIERSEKIWFSSRSPRRPSFFAIQAKWVQTKQNVVLCNVMLIDVEPC